MAANKKLLLCSSLVTLALLVGAAFQENVLREWRRLQRAHAAGLGAEAAAGFHVQLRQTVVPALRAADRCVSCHVGMAPGETALAVGSVSAAHPPVVHDPGEYGCTICHGGQGRATDSADAHGETRHWPEPMIPKKHSQAGCGTCHTPIGVPNAERLAWSQGLFERYDCLACHAVDGRGGTLRPGVRGTGAGYDGPDLSHTGIKGWDRGWYGKHLSRRQSERDPAGRWHASFAEIPPVDRSGVEQFLATRVGAPKLVEAKAVFHSLGCRGCHKVRGVGGDEGPDLSREGRLDPGQLDFTHVPGERTVGNWLTRHFRAPAAVVAGSLMPEMNLTDGQIDSLNLFLLSQRGTPLPDPYLPNDRIRVDRFGEREFATDGATLYGVFCAACHGPQGEGMRYAGMEVFPAIGNPDFLAVAPDGLLEATVQAGRPGRRMPAWGRIAGGLRPEEIASVVRHVRGLSGGVAFEGDPLPPRWVKADPVAGRALFASACAPCHGAEGKGGAGPALNNTVLLAHATDSYLVETIRRGRRGTAMEGFSRPSPVRPALHPSEIEAVVAFLRTWEVTP